MKFTARLKKRSTNTEFARANFSAEKRIKYNKITVYIRFYNYNDKYD